MKEGGAKMKLQPTGPHTIDQAPPSPEKRGRPAHGPGGRTKRRLLVIHSLVVLAFLYVPMAIIAVYSFNDSRMNAVWHGFTLEWYVSLFTNDYLLEALMNSLIIAVGSTVLSTMLGTLTALAIRRNERWRGFVSGLMYMPILIPDIVMGLSLLVLFTQLYIPLGRLTILIAHITFSISYVFVIVSARFEGMNPHLEEAAMDLGAGPWETFRHVTLPLIAPGIIAGALISFTLSIDDFMISFFVSGPEATTLPLYIYGLVKRGISPEINALSTIMILLTVALVVLAEKLRSRGNNEAERALF
jgi:spermidine/putrescine transport system permease protein